MKIRGIAAVVLAMALVAATALPAYAAPQWLIVPSPSPVAQPSGSLAGIACPTATVCFIVGGDSPMAERSNGSTWTLVALPKPAGTDVARLWGIACPTATSCFAVGFAQVISTGNEKTLIEHWNGSSWAIQTSPNPAGETNLLRSISCPSPTSCFAIGSNQSGSTQQAMIVHWNGTAWAVQPSVNPAGSTFKDLRGIACPSTTNCFAVGSLEAGPSSTPFGEHWNGSAWSLATFVKPAGATLTMLNAVHCPTTTSCFTVGSAQTNSTVKTLIEHWNGTAWSITASPNASGVPSSALLGVTCPSATSCVAVGETNPTAGIQGAGNTLAERMTGTTWTIVGSPNPATDKGSSLAAVACPAAAHCFAAGSEYFVHEAFVEEWNGSAWALDAPPVGSSQSQLTGVTCPVSTSCFAVGLNSTGTGYKTVIEHWNGTAWAIMPSPNPAGANPSDIRFTGVACATATTCFAVGTYNNTSNRPTALLERWNGSTWVLLTAPKPVLNPGPPPTYSPQTYFNGISCPSATSCYAVGASEATNGYLRTFIAKWNGSSWGAQNAPTTAGTGDTILYAVSCDAATSCFAVGSHSASGGTAANTFIARVNGGTWGPSTSPSSAFSGLTSVSCASASSCFALGHATSAVLAERWNGTTWTTVATGAPAGSHLEGVSCPLATTICWAVGWRYGAPAPFATKWNGSSWAAVALPARTGSTSSGLAAVTCSSAVLCRAVGHYVANSLLYTLIEQYQ